MRVRRHAEAATDRKPAACHPHGVLTSETRRSESRGPPLLQMDLSTYQLHALKRWDMADILDGQPFQARVATLKTAGTSLHEDMMQETCGGGHPLLPCPSTPGSNGLVKTLLT